MDSGLYVLGNRMQGLGEALQAVSANLANANSSGYKRQVSSFHGALQNAMTPGAGQVRPGEMSAAVWPRYVGPKVDLSQGTARHTGRPLDVAIQGSAFLAVATEDGVRYTRKGRLYVDSNGELVDGAGHPFMSDGGTLQIPEDAGRVSIEENGELRAKGQSVGRLRLVDLPDPRALVPVGAGLYRNDGPPAEAATDSTVIQGALESSNVQPMQEVVLLLNVSRAYESASRIVRQMDKSSSRLINSAA
jgi:flagellar basal body rod protein FlgG